MEERQPMFFVESILLSIATACIVFYLCFLAPLAATVSFDLSNFDRETKLTCSPKQEGICLQGDAFLNQGLQLTKNEIGSLASSVGRAVYSQPVQIWDSATGRMSDFTTNFSFIIRDVDSGSPSGDGLAFFLSSHPSVIPKDSAGGFLGLFPNSSHSDGDGKMVAIEFDTYPNSDLDSSSSDHIGISVNSIRSVVHLPLKGGIKKRILAQARIEYDAKRQTLSVALDYDDASLEGSAHLSYLLDLKKVLPEYVSVGFSAATGSLVETHTILSWSFDSKLDARGSGTTMRLVLMVILAGILSFLAGLSMWSWRKLDMGGLQENIRYVVFPSEENEIKEDKDIHLVDAEHVQETGGREEVPGLDTTLTEGSEQVPKKDENISDLDGMSMKEAGRNLTMIISSDYESLTKQEGGQKDEDVSLDAECMEGDGNEIITPSNAMEGGTDLDDGSPSVSMEEEGWVSHKEAPIKLDPLNRWSPQEIPYPVLVSATNNFSEEMILGKGGFGSVYRGFLSDLAIDVAIKRLSERSEQGLSEYMAEVNIITQLRHRNLVKLIGWCREHEELMLVYEFMPNGSLNNHLFKESNLLEWSLRYKIVLGLANALMYLHDECDPYVLHRDVKSSNVLLDSKFDAKLGDFGLARRSNLDSSSLRVTHPAGTRGYWAPEYAFTCKASRRSDVYSFGVVALEVACGKKAILVIEGEDGESYARLLVEWVWDIYGEGSILGAADRRLNGNFDRLEMERLLMVGLWCAQPDPRKRPSMRQASNALLFPETTALPDLPKEVVSWTYPVASIRMQVAQLSHMTASSPTLTSVSDDSVSSHSGDGNLNALLKEPKAYKKPKRWLFPQFTWWWVRRSRSRSIGELLGDDPGFKKLIVDLSTLRVATANFSNVLFRGHGALGPVYKGLLPDGKEVAVKRLTSYSLVLEWRNEVALLSKVQHRNLVRFLGFCLEGEKKFLIYEYARYGTLDKFLFVPTRSRHLDWEKRYKIITGIARGLQYLREGSQLKIIHGNVNARGILLDAAMDPKIADFPLTRLFGGDQTEASTTRVVGTLGNISPDYAMTCHYSNKTDVFSFGVLVLEIVTGQRNLRLNYNPPFNINIPGSELRLSSYVWERWTNGSVQEIIDPTLGGQYEMSEVIRCIQIGLLSTQKSPTDRPTMSSVVHMLSDYSMSLQVPCKPELFAYEERLLEYSSNEVSITELEPR